ncbi:MAG: hypothetical protein CVT61_01275 [Actinobacteria bacterium HGW-Actinobacteria-11]|nr:MAG: hypothetical protein CVT61_01275 [Actinobacteria bacterium HGW-Actinobacteria-11]
MDELKIVTSAVRSALESRDWPLLVSLLGAHWSILFDENPDLLDQVLYAVPGALVRSDPAAAATRDIRLHSLEDPSAQMLGRPLVPEVDDLRELEGYARSRNPLGLLRTVASQMIAYRVRGEYLRAARFAELTVSFGRVAVVHAPALIQPRLPNALLQAGITLGLADDIPGAIEALQSAYEQAPLGRAHHVERDAAGKLALFHALHGDYRRAAQWAARYDDASITESPHSGRLNRTGRLAHALIATETLQYDRAESFVLDLEQPVAAEKGWAPIATYILARHALVWGDRLSALAALQQDRGRLAPWLGGDSTMGPLLAQAEADIHLSFGHGNRAESAIAPVAKHPIGQVTRARIALVGHRYSAAAKLSATAIRKAHSPRMRIDALATRVLTRMAREESGAAVGTLSELATSVERFDARLAGSAVSPQEADPATSTAGVPVRPILPAQATEVALTTQQRAVLRGLADGKTLSEIARDAHLSVNTIKTHRRGLYARLEVDSRDDAVARGYDLGLL